MNRILWLLLLLCALVACEKAGEEQKPPSLEEQVVGKWKNREITNGVEYYITFHHDHTISQVFVAPDGHARLYSGSWVLGGDTLTIEDKRGRYHMLITEMMDSTMVMVRTDSMALLFDRYPDAEGLLPEP